MLHTNPHSDGQADYAEIYEEIPSLVTNQLPNALNYTGASYHAGRRTTSASHVNPSFELPPPPGVGGSIGRGADYSYIDEDTTDDGYSRAEIEYAAAVTAVSAAAAPTSTSGPNPFNYITSGPYDDGLPAAAVAASSPGTAYGRPIGLPTAHLREVSNGGWMNQTEL